MYLHLGQNVVVQDDDIIGVFDLDNTTGSKITRDFLNRAEKDGRVRSVGTDIPKSFVVCTDENNTVYLSQMGTATLKSRSESAVFLDITEKG